jgi:uncharacterized protein
MRAIILFFFIVTMVSKSFAQKQDSLTLVAHNSIDKVILKWLPGDYDTWTKGVKNGYFVERYEMQQVAGKWKMLDKQVLTKAPIRAWSREQLIKESVDDPELKKVEIIFDGQELEDNKQPKGLKESADLQSKKGFLYIGSLFTQVMHNKSAEALGAYYEDKTAVIGKTYLYRVTMNTPNKLKADVVVDRKQFTTEPNIAGFTFNRIHKGVELYWLNPVSSGYVCYNIFRAESKSGPFTKVNDLPYIGDVTPVADSKKMRYTDTFPSLDKVYYYKVVGWSVFQKESPPSAILKVEPAYFLQKAPRIIDAISLNNKDVMLAWEVEEEEKAYVKSFKVYNSSSPIKGFKKINEKNIDGKTYGYTDLRDNKRTFNYYMVCAFGAAGDSTCSLAKDMFLKDSIPPAPPTIVYGVCDSNGVVTLKWKRNKEADAIGYRVFRTYDTQKEPERLTKEYTRDTLLVDTVDVKSGWKHIYYTVTAIDEVYNASDLCKYFAVPMPDKIPPVNAIFKKYSADAKGIKLEWLNSPSADIKVQYLFRKSELDFAWQPILKLTADSLTLVETKDTLTQSTVWYDYALMAEDSSGLKSKMSEPLRVQQPDKDPYPVVKNLQAFVSREYNLIKLTWEFNLNATSFKIMRAKKGATVETYEFVPGSKREFYDKWLTPNTEYQYAIIAETPGGKRSLMSKKIVAKY